MKGIKRISWKEVERMCDDLIQQVKISGKQVEGVWGVPRGGIVPAVIISHRMGLPLRLDSGPAYYNGTLLVVDDICDSGITVSKLLDKKRVVVTLGYKLYSATKPDYYSEMDETDDYWIFPWEDSKKEMTKLKDL